MCVIEHQQTGAGPSRAAQAQTSLQSSPPACSIFIGIRLRKPLPEEEEADYIHSFIRSFIYGRDRQPTAADVIIIIIILDININDSAESP